MKLIIFAIALVACVSAELFPSTSTPSDPIGAYDIKVVKEALKRGFSDLSHTSTMMNHFVKTGSLHPDRDAGFLTKREETKPDFSGTAAECSAAFDTLWDTYKGACKFDVLEDDTKTDLEKATAATAWCPDDTTDSCHKKMKDALIAFVDNCREDPAIDADLKEALAEWVATVRELLGVICIKDGADFCFEKWVKFADAISTASDATYADDAAEAAAFVVVAQQHCTGCLRKFFKRAMEFAVERTDETPAQLKARLKGYIGVQLLCMKHIDDPTKLCVDSFSKFTALLKKKTTDPPPPEHISAMGEMLCGYDKCLPRYAFAQKFWGDEGDASAKELLTLVGKIGGLCIRDDKGDICFTKSYTALTKWTKDVETNKCSDDKNCANDEKCKDITVEAFDTTMGCCQKVFWAQSILLDDDCKGDKRAKCIKDKGDILGVFYDSCGIKEYPVCKLQELKFKWTVANVLVKTWTAKRDAILDALKRDVQVNTGGSEAGNVTDLTVNMVKRAGEMVLEVEQTQKFDGTAADCAKLKSGLTGEDVVLKDTSKAVGPEGTKDVTAPLTVSQSGGSCTDIEGDDVFGKVSKSSASTVSMSLLVLFALLFAMM